MSFNSNLLCRFYSKGILCKYGDSCRYLHTSCEVSSQSDSLSRSPNQASLENLSELNSSTNSNLKTNHESLKETKGSVQSSKCNSSVNKGQSRQVCKYFSEHQTCAFGRNCRFSHIKSSKNAVKEEQNVFQPETSELSEELKHLPNIHDDEENNDNSPELASTSTATDETPEELHDEKGKNICDFYAKRGWCRFGKRCHFSHVRIKSRQEKPPKVSENRDNIAKEAKSKPPVQQEDKAKTRLCSHFQRGFCRAGERCRFWHPLDVMQDLTYDFEKSLQSKDKQEFSTPQDASPTPNINQTASLQMGAEKRRIVRPANQVSVHRVTAEDDEIQQLRKTEIDQLKKRFARDHSTVVDDGPDMFQCRVVFKPTDPDWPFDVKQFELLFSVPSTYPKQMMKITLPDDQGLPETVNRYIESSIVAWLKERDELLVEKGTYEIVFRHFLRWFDRNIESQVTEGLRQMKRQMVAKAAGFEFINASELKEKYKKLEDADKYDKDEEEIEKNIGEDDSGADSDDHEDDNTTGDASTAMFDPDTEKAGTEVSLRNFQLREGAGTMRFQKVHVVIHCSRCKHQTDFVTPPGRINSISCGKCNQVQMVAFRPVLLHQFSSVMGYMDLDSCTAFDVALQHSPFIVGCTKCNKESKFEGLLPGQVLDTWCRHCHQKLRVAADSVRFAQLQASRITTDSKKNVHQVKVRKLRVPKDPAIQEGKPLPDKGTCKHYKKSYRWFRFPCCGMVHPCDICHEEKSDGHEMVFANRVICGFCCKEQPYAPDKPCLSCMQMLTRSKSSHWEGGLGCRNKVKMGRNDSQKYANTNKTVSKHAQKLKEANSKKKTKS